ncbi:MAG: hypothetical protein IKZ61_07625, partial [Prevotella sp.]|nr:hypothetical protein [Prevotella sp.]
PKRPDAKKSVCHKDAYPVQSILGKGHQNIKRAAYIKYRLTVVPIYPDRHASSRATRFLYYFSVL